jgi:hypothetical protein
MKSPKLENFFKTIKEIASPKVCQILPKHLFEKWGNLENVRKQLLKGQLKVYFPLPPQIYAILENEIGWVVYNLKIKTWRCQKIKFLRKHKNKNTIKKNKKNDTNYCFFLFLRKSSKN